MSLPPLQPLQRAELGRALESKGYRLTRQRAVVYEYLAGVTSHPTAEEVYTAVKGEIPNISLATVYKALESLVTSNVAQKLAYGDSSAHYDARVEDHQHVRCQGCGEVRDIMSQDSAENLMARLVLPDDFHPARVRVEVVGLCGRCNN
jgi:Fe2+ or Zn2+ uptake regulation protein